MIQAQEGSLGFRGAYPFETVIAEKFHAMVLLGRAKPRMKDYYDIWMLLRAFDPAPARVRQALAATFARRGTSIPADVPGGLSDAFASDAGKQRQWAAFARNVAGPPPALGQVIDELRQRLTIYLDRG